MEQELVTKRLFSNQQSILLTKVQNFIKRSVFKYFIASVLFAIDINLFIDPGSNRTAYFSFEERDFFLTSLSLFLAPIGEVSYQIRPKVSACLRFTFKPYGNFYLYQLRIQGKTADMPDGNHILNDSRINNKLMFLNLGISYSL